MKDLTIGELAKSAEVNSETIRYYERQGLIQKPPRLQSGYRAFPAQTVDQIRFIKQAQELGFSLKEIKELIVLRDNPKATGSDVRLRTEAKLLEIEEKMRTLQSIKSELLGLMATCNGPGAIKDCPIIKSLSSKKS